MIPFKAMFTGHGQSVDPVAGRLVLDTGNRCLPGVIDHHQDSNTLNCSATIIFKRPDLVLDHIGQMPLSEVEIMLHYGPDFDAIISAYLAACLIANRAFPAGAAQLAEYALHVDQATLPASANPEKTPYGIYAGIIRVIDDDPQPPSGDDNPSFQRSYRMLDRGLALIAYMNGMVEKGHSLYDEDLFSPGHDFAAEQESIATDYRRYLADLASGYIYNVDLERIDGSGVMPADLLVVKDPTAAMFKVWARQDFINSPARQGFVMLCVQYGASRFVLSVEPRSGVWLKGLGDALDQLETAKRETLGLPREGPPRPGYNNSDPWYDGRSAVHNYTIVDAPRSGTALSRAETLAIALHPELWPV